MEENPDKNTDKEEREEEVEKKDVNPYVCPQCQAAQLQRQGACVRCPNCGFYSCGID